MSGQLIKRNENTWLVRIFLGRDAGGKRKYFNQTIHGTKKEAQKFLTAKTREKDLGIFVEPAAMSLNEYLDKWFEETAKPRLRESTYNQYVWIAKSYIRKQLGLMQLADIQAYQVQKCYGELKKQGLSPRTIRYTHNVLSSAMKQAVKWKTIIQNPCELCDLPRQEKKEMLCLSPVETQKFLTVAKESKWFALFLTVIETGMRPEEYLGLQWKDIDFEHRNLSVRRAAIEKKGGGFYFTEPKTKKSRRKIPISNSVLIALKSHRRNQLEERMKIASEYNNNDLVFASELGTPLQRKNFTGRHFKPLLKKAELPNIRLYDLRHTTATLLLSAGENPKVVSERLGHASIVLTLDTYSHVLPTMQEAATEKLEKMMFVK
jgi:integrase